MRAHPTNFYQVSQCPLGAVVIGNNLFQLLSNVLDQNPNSDVASCNLIKVSSILFIFHWDKLAKNLQVYKFRRCRFYMSSDLILISD